MNATLPSGLVLPLRDYLDEFRADMGMLEDQNYSTDEVVIAMVDAARGANPRKDLHEVTEHFTAMHALHDQGSARQFLGTLGCCIEDTINKFGFRLEDGRFPYVISDEKAGIYYMQKFQT